MRIRQIVDSRYPSVKPDDLLTHARALMRELALTMLPVVDDERKVVGILRRSHILTLSSTKSNALVRDVMDSPNIVFKLNEDLSKAVRIMLEFDEWYTPVVEPNKEKYIGIASLETFIKFVLKRRSENVGLPVTEYMTKEVEYVLPEDRVSKLWRKMTSLRISGFPVVNNPKELKVVGMITQHDLLKKGCTRIELESEGGPKKGPKVREAMTSPAITLSPKSDIMEAASIMADRGIGRIPIVDEKNRLIGIIDRSDVSLALLTKEVFK